jgi:Uma2 family endonuclease
LLIASGVETIQASGTVRMATGFSIPPVSFPPMALPVEWNLADLRRHLGGIPLKRIRLYPPPGMATEEDALRLREQEDTICEVIDGILVEKVMASYEAVLAGLILHWLNAFLEKHALGVALAPDGMLRILPNRTRVPDISFISWERFPNRKLPRDRVFAVAPDLAIEILSPGNTPAEMALKLKDYFRAGTRLVWYIDPNQRTAQVYRSPNDVTEVPEAGELDGGEILPGFHLKLKDLFARVPRE